MCWFKPTHYIKKSVIHKTVQIFTRSHTADSKVTRRYWVLCTAGYEKNKSQWRAQIRFHVLRNSLFLLDWSRALLEEGFSDRPSFSCFTHVSPVVTATDFITRTRSLGSFFWHLYFVLTNLWTQPLNRRMWNILAILCGRFVPHRKPNWNLTNKH
jgi:hypothetical protein